MKPLRILVTGERNHGVLPRNVGSQAVEWTELPVLNFTRIPVAAETLKRLSDTPTDWIFFTSPRAVRFWMETWLESGVDFPTETHVGCIGQATAEAAAQDGFPADFCPEEAGSESFLQEFELVIAAQARKPSVVIPLAQGGRLLIAQRLSELGCHVEVITLYRSEAKTDLLHNFSQTELEKMDGVLFTSPSSVEAFLSHFQIPEKAKVFAIGSFTQGALLKLGYPQVKIIPASDINRISEVW